MSATPGRVEKLRIYNHAAFQLGCLLQFLASSLDQACYWFVVNWGSGKGTRPDWYRLKCFQSAGTDSLTDREVLVKLEELKSHHQPHFVFIAKIIKHLTSMREFTWEIGGACQSPIQNDPAVWLSSMLLLLRDQSELIGLPDPLLSLAKTQIDSVLRRPAHDRFMLDLCCSGPERYPVFEPQAWNSFVSEFRTGGLRTRKELPQICDVVLSSTLTRIRLCRVFVGVIEDHDLNRPLISMERRIIQVIEGTEAPNKESMSALEVLLQDFVGLLRKLSKVYRRSERSWFKLGRLLSLLRCHRGALPGQVLDWGCRSYCLVDELKLRPHLERTTGSKISLGEILSGEAAVAEVWHQQLTRYLLGLDCQTAITAEVFPDARMAPQPLVRPHPQPAKKKRRRRRGKTHVGQVVQQPQHHALEVVLNHQPVRVVTTHGEDESIRSTGEPVARPVYVKRLTKAEILQRLNVQLEPRDDEKVFYEGTAMDFKLSPLRRIRAFRMLLALKESNGNPCEKDDLEKEIKRGERRGFCVSKEDLADGRKDLNKMFRENDVPLLVCAEGTAYKLMPAPLAMDLLRQLTADPQLKLSWKGSPLEFKSRWAETVLMRAVSEKKVYVDFDWARRHATDFPSEGEAQQEAISMGNKALQKQRVPLRFLHTNHRIQIIRGQPDK